MIFGTIRSKDGRYSYQITQQDVLALYVSIWKEGGDPAATTWTYLQRMVAFRGRSLYSMVLSHSQTINPAWRADRCSESARRAGARVEEHCSPSLLARRAENARLLSNPAALNQVVPQRIKDVVNQVVSAQLQNPVPRAIDFADARVTTGYLARPAHHEDYVVLASGNWYVTDRQSRSWEPDLVRIEAEGRVATGSTLPRATLTVDQQATLLARRVANGFVARVEDTVEEVVGNAGSVVRRAPAGVSLSVVGISVVLLGLAYYVAENRRAST